MIEEIGLFVETWAEPERVGCPECENTEFVAVYHGWSTRKLAVFTNGDCEESTERQYQGFSDRWVECSSCGWEGQLEYLLPQED